ncbi:phosphate acyltransferase PlsX [Pokkaliibacter plantistimulans]|nr:phosphate acyltransferase PlsX [Pokkaliibacter plantistimulans]
MPLRTTIAVDVMGGDFGPRVTLPAIFKFLSSQPDVDVRLYGAQDVLLPFVQKHKSLAARISVAFSQSDIAMSDKPSQVLRSKRDSSMAIGLRALSEGEVDAMVSAGNTGALMAMACTILGRLEGVDRPAIATTLPTRKGQCLLIDLGANLEATSRHLYSYAIMGSVLAALMTGRADPGIALLNVGEEPVKGSGVVQAAAEILANDKRLRFIGFVEGDGMFEGRADVVVCNGFVGNVALKTGEGVARLIVDSLSEYLKAHWYSRLLATMLMPSLRAWGKRFEPAIYNGAVLAGVNGCVVKSHGGASEAAFLNALNYAAMLTRLKLPARLQEALVDSDISSAT